MRDINIHVDYVKGAICEHGKQKYYCKICLGSAICQHKRRRYLCKECHGKGIRELG